MGEQSHFLFVFGVVNCSSAVALQRVPAGHPPIGCLLGAADARNGNPGVRPAWPLFVRRASLFCFPPRAGGCKKRPGESGGK